MEGLNKAIGIKYFSGSCDYKLLLECETILGKYNISILKIDMQNKLLNSALDFTDLDLIAIGYILLQNILISGSYDVFKSVIQNLWTSITNKSSSKIPFTIRISGIPTLDGSENIACKVYGNTTKKQKDQIIEKTFELAHNISDNQVKLMERSMFYNSFGAHVFRIDADKLELSEIDIEKEIRKKVNKS